MDSWSSDPPAIGAIGGRLSRSKHIGGSSSVEASSVHPARPPRRERVDLCLRRAARQRDRSVHRLLVVGIVHLRDAQDDQLLEVARQRSLVTHSARIGGLRAQQPRREPGDAMDIEEMAAARPDVREHLGEDRIVGRLRGAAET